MEYRQRETEGAPYVLGMAAGVLLIFASLFCGGETAACPVWSFLAAGGGDGAEPRRLYAAASFRKAPGGEGEALCRPVGCGWGVYGAFGLFSDFRLRCFQNGRRNSIPFFAEAAMSAAFRFAGGALMIASCAQFYKRLQGRA